MSDVTKREPAPEQLALKVGDEVVWFRKSPYLAVPRRCRVDMAIRQADWGGWLIGVDASGWMVDLREVTPA